MRTSNTTAAAVSDADILAEIERLALQAGRAVMDIFRSKFAVECKPDDSPVTEADRAAETIILHGLRAHFPEIKCVAEEECAAGKQPRELGRAFFLIDPLDGTREFVNRHHDFTVNIALVRDGVPEVGVVYAPASGRLFRGLPGRADAAEVLSDLSIANRRPIAVRQAVEPYTIVASRSHRTPETDAYIVKFGVAEIVSVGSSLKFCLIAAGEADLYPRFGPTMEWDTAAGDAVLRAAGGMTETLDGQPLPYGKKDRVDQADFANPAFICRGRLDRVRADARTPV